MMPRLLLQTALAGLLVCTALTSAQAQQVPQAVPVADVEATALSPWQPGGSEQTILVPVNKARSIQLPSPVRDVIVANPAIADVVVQNQQQIFVVGRSAGTTSVFFVAPDGSVILQAEIKVDSDVAAIQAALDELIEGSNVKISAHGSTLFLSGTVRSSAQAVNAADIARRFVPETTDVVNMLKIQESQQVVLQVRIAEISRNLRKGLGIGQTIRQGNTTITTSGNSDITSTTLGASAFGSGTFFTGIPGFTSSSFSALEETGLVKTLAEPTLTAVSGETANFLVGGEFPSPSAIDDSGNLTYSMQPFGIGLNFTPVVESKGLINLRIQTEVSSISTTNSLVTTTATFRGLDVRRAGTTVDLPSGGSMMIAGLLKDSDSDTLRGLPFLKDVPILGALFRSTAYQRSESELVVMVTAYLASATDNSQPLAKPTDGWIPPSDLDVYLLGRLHKVYTKSELPVHPGPALQGPYGYVLE